MSSLADLPELVGFFSYSREDDADSHGALSALRNRIQGELRGQLGRTAKTFRLWQDKEAIPSGTLWESEIKNAAAQSVFFIPIITPTVVTSPYCRFELESFIAREAALGRDDLVFPILYIDVPGLEDAAERKDPVLSLIAKRQYVDWREFRYLDVNSTEVKRAIGRFCADVRNALCKPWVSPEEKAAALARAETERAESKRREEEARRTAETQARDEAEAEQRKKDEAEARRRQEEEIQRREVEAERKAETERRRAEEQHLREEAETKLRAEEEKRRAEKEERRRLRRSQARPFWPPSRPAVVAASLIGVVALGAIGAWYALSSTPAPVAPITPVHITVTPLSPQQERALKPKDTFKECTHCPQMMVVPAGSFTMGSPRSEPEREPDEGPQHTVTLARQFAVGQFELTFDEWDACVATGGCNGYKPSDEGWGRGRQPAINVSWDDANAYVAWLSKLTGKSYRLLSEAEYEYATRAGTQTAYPWGNAIGENNANCNGCSSPPWDNRQTAPVGSFAPNKFGLYDMVGNVWEWTEDCWHGSYQGAPADGSAWTSDDCGVRVVRGGSLDNIPDVLRSANRFRFSAVLRVYSLGFRVARTLTP
jgi:formylglycine-generating enzyme required for sulfatase activity